MFVDGAQILKPTCNRNIDDSAVTNLSLKTSPAAVYVKVQQGKNKMLKLIKEQTPANSQIQVNEKPTSAKKIAANQLNGKKSHGPLDTLKTKQNATKHGIRAAGLSKLDSVADYQKLLQDLTEEHKPVGRTETFLVEALALKMTKRKLAGKLDADFIDDSIYYPERPPLYTGPIEPRLRPHREVTESLILNQRYASSLLAQLLKILHELERLQRRRLGEEVPAPAALDINLHIDANNEEKAELDSPTIEQVFPPIEPALPDAKTDGVQ
jgi:phosphoribosylanthranilate isomerase